ncbi:MAG: 16S rRNA (guanine(527)-N(7))-methyltransferase RsmG [Phycisphaerales bacterium]|nr:MAG: 16S rRNA (guanine(527)-N(7))-methyltransferase RsmG [Phycisphaerales bacterium]
MAELFAGFASLPPVPVPDDLVAEAGSLDIAFDPGDLDRLSRYLAMLFHANRHMNLTAVRDADEAWMRHIFDSLTLVPYIASADAKCVIDVGSGAGLPGMVLAIAMPQVRFTLLESTGKKARFLEAVARVLDLDNIAVVNDRAESVGRDRANHREKYEIVTARAVGGLPVLLELTIPLAVMGGHVLAVKGRRAKEEINSAQAALRLLHARVVDTVRTPTGTIVIVEKQRRTPRVYPRSPGEPKRAPLGGKAPADSRTDHEGGC